jgi:hypothetical protein
MSPTDRGPSSRHQSLKSLCSFASVLNNAAASIVRSCTADTRAVLNRARIGGICSALMSESNEAKGTDLGARGAYHRNRKMVAFRRAGAHDQKNRLYVR